MPGPYSLEFPEREVARLVYTGHLEVREDGSVWRLRRQDGRPYEPRRVDYPDGAKRRYRTVRQKVEGDLYSVRAHRLVWQVHRGDIPEGVVVNHRDGNPANNRLDNLELATQAENQRHRYRTLGHKASFTVVRERYESVVQAARDAVATGDLSGLRVALASFDDV